MLCQCRLQIGQLHVYVSLRCLSARGTQVHSFVSCWLVSAT